MLSLGPSALKKVWAPAVLHTMFVLMFNWWNMSNLLKIIIWVLLSLLKMKIFFIFKEMIVAKPLSVGTLILILGRLRAGGERGNSEWDGWLASLTQWTWEQSSSGMIKDREAWHTTFHDYESQTWLKWQNNNSSMYMDCVSVCMFCLELLLSNKGEITEDYELLKWNR